MPPADAAAGNVPVPVAAHSTTRRVRGLYITDRNLATGETRKIPDVCTGCFGYLHAPKDRDNPRVTEWFSIPTGLVD